MQLRHRRQSTPPQQKKTAKRRFTVGKIVYFSLLVTGIAWGANYGYRQFTRIEGFGFIDATIFRVRVTRGGRLQKLLVKENEDVRKGQALVTLLPLASRPELDRGRLTLAAARHKRLARLDQEKRQREVTRRRVQLERDLMVQRRGLGLSKAKARAQRKRVAVFRRDLTKAKALFRQQALTSDQLATVEQKVTGAQIDLETLVSSVKEEQKLVATLDTALKKVKTQKIAPLPTVAIDETAFRKPALPQELTLTSGIDGEVYKIHKNASETATRDEVIMRILASDARIMAFFKPKFRRRIHVGQKAEIIYPDGDEFSGTVVRIYPKATTSLTRFGRMAIEKELIMVRIAFDTSIPRAIQRSLGVKCAIYLK